MDTKTRQKFAKKTQELMKTQLASHVNKRFGFHQINEALAFYKANQTAGKVLLQAGLTKEGASGGSAQGSGLMKIYTSGPGHFYYYNVKMTADYCNYPVQVVIVDEEMAKTKEIKDKKGTGKYPFVETTDGTILH